MTPRKVKEEVEKEAAEDGAAEDGAAENGAAVMAAVMAAAMAAVMAAGRPRMRRAAPGHAMAATRGSAKTA